jgi:DUF4097 and DUF4098 domain-containing protein YvlB
MATSRTLLVNLAAASMLALTGCQDLGSNRFKAEKVITKSFTPKATPRIVVETFNGKIEAMVGPESAVQIEATKFARAASQEAADEALEAIEVDMTQEGDTIRVRARKADELSSGNRGVAFSLQTPVGTILDLHTTNGKTTVVGLAGDVRAATSNGEIGIKGSKGKLHLQTSSGAIHVDGGSKEIEAQTSNGGIHIKSDKAVVKANTSNGSIEFAGRLIDGEYSLETMNGAIKVALPDDATFHIDAETSNGRVDCDFDLDQSETHTKAQLRGTVGKGTGSSIKLQTMNGRIKIMKEMAPT